MRLAIHPSVVNYALTQEGYFPLYGASQNGYDGIMKMLLQAGATLDLQLKVEDCHYD